MGLSRNIVDTSWQISLHKGHFPASGIDRQASRDLQAVWKTLERLFLLKGSVQHIATPRPLEEEMRSTTIVQRTMRATIRT